MTQTKKIWLGACGLSLLAIVLLGLWVFQLVYSYFTVDCNSNRQIERDAPAFGQIDTTHFESIQAENILRLTLLGTFTAENQDIDRANPVFSPDGRYLALGGVSAARDGSTTNDEACGNIWVWDLQRGGINVLRITEGRPTVTELYFSADSTSLRSREFRAADAAHVTRLWKLSENALQPLESDLENTIVFNTPQSSPYLLAGDDQSKFMFTVAGSGVGFWNASTGKTLLTLPNTPQFSASHAAVSPDDKLLIVTGWDQAYFQRVRQTVSIVQVWAIPSQPR